MGDANPNERISKFGKKMATRGRGRRAQPAADQAASSGGAPPFAEPAPAAAGAGPSQQPSAGHAGAGQQQQPSVSGSGAVLPPAPAHAATSGLAGAAANNTAAAQPAHPGVIIKQEPGLGRQQAAAPAPPPAPGPVAAAAARVPPHLPPLEVPAADAATALAGTLPTARSNSEIPPQQQQRQQQQQQQQQPVQQLPPQAVAQPAAAAAPPAPAAAPAPLPPGAGVPLASSITALCGCPPELPPLREGELRVLGFTIHPQLAATYQDYQRKWEDQVRSAVKPKDTEKALRRLKHVVQLNAAEEERRDIERYDFLSEEDWGEEFAPLVAESVGGRDYLCDLVNANGQRLQDVEVVDEGAAGLGLRAAKDLKPGHVLGPLAGYLMTFDQFKVIKGVEGAQACPVLPHHNPSLWALKVHEYISMNTKAKGYLPFVPPQGGSTQQLVCCGLGYGNQGQLMNDDNVVDDEDDEDFDGDGAGEGESCKHNVEVIMLNIKGMPLPFLVTVADVPRGASLRRQHSDHWWKQYGRLRLEVPLEVLQAAQAAAAAPPAQQQHAAPAPLPAAKPAASAASSLPSGAAAPPSAPWPVIVPPAAAPAPATASEVPPAAPVQPVPTAAAGPAAQAASAASAPAWPEPASGEAQPMAVDEAPEAVASRQQQQQQQAEAMEDEEEERVVVRRRRGRCSGAAPPSSSQGGAESAATASAARAEPAASGMTDSQAVDAAAADAATAAAAVEPDATAGGAAAVVKVEKMEVDGAPEAAAPAAQQHAAAAGDAAGQQHEDGAVDLDYLEQVREEGRLKRLAADGWRIPPLSDEDARAAIACMGPKPADGKLLTWRDLIPKDFVFEQSIWPIK